MEINRSQKSEDYRKFAVFLAEKAGNFVYKNFGKLNKIEKKGFKDYVTNVDKESERMIVEAIRRKFPDHDILAEEGGSLNKKSDYFWVIDPLDGTHNYMTQIPIYGVSIALCFKKKPIVGAIYLPHLKEMYEAEKKKGAFLNGKKIKVSKNKLLKESFIFLEGPFKEGLEEKIKNFEVVSKEAEKTRILGSMVFQLSYIASGRAEGIIAETGRPWDYAAAFIIVKEAGGMFTSHQGKEFTINDRYVVVSNGKIHSQLLKLISSK